MSTEHEWGQGQDRPDAGTPPRISERIRLPGFDEPGRREGRRAGDRSGNRGPAYRPGPPDQDWPDDLSADWRDGYGARGYPGAYRAGGVRAGRRASAWTAAALIAGVAATTGYLAHAIGATGPGTSPSGGTGSPAAKPGTVTPAAPTAPAVKPPVATSGGSGATGSGGGDN